MSRRKAAAKRAGSARRLARGLPRRVLRGQKRRSDCDFRVVHLRRLRSVMGLSDHSSRRWPRRFHDRLRHRQACRVFQRSPTAPRRQRGRGPGRRRQLLAQDWRVRFAQFPSAASCDRPRRGARAQQQALRWFSARARARPRHLSGIGPRSRRRALFVSAHGNARRNFRAAAKRRWKRCSAGSSVPRTGSAAADGEKRERMEEEQQSVIEHGRSRRKVDWH